MPGPIVTFTDFGFDGPYLGQVRLALDRVAPGLPVIDLMADAPAFDPQASAYLLAALVLDLPQGAIVLGVVDPGVGGSRLSLVVEADGRLFVGPDNGLFEIVLRRAASVRAWEITWQPERLSSTFHGRDLFAPVAGRLARGDTPERAGCSAIEAPCRPDWPDDLAEIIYIDGYGNCWTGLRAGQLGPDARVMGLAFARTYAETAPGTLFWYENSNGLAEIGRNGGSAADALSLAIGSPVPISPPLYTLVAK